MGKLKGIIAIAIIASGIYAGYELIPPYFHNYQFQDDLDDIARRATYTPRSDEDLRAIVIQKAGSEDIPLKENQITISRMPEGVGISVHYQIHVDLIIRPVDLDFTANSLNKRI